MPREIICPICGERMFISGTEIEDIEHSELYDKCKIIGRVEKTKQKFVYRCLNCFAELKFYETDEYKRIY